MLDPRLTAKDPPPKRKCQYVRPGAPVQNPRLQIRRPNRNRHHDGACGLARQPAHPTISNVSAALPRRFSLLTWTTRPAGRDHCQAYPKKRKGVRRSVFVFEGPSHNFSPVSLAARPTRRLEKRRHSNIFFFWKLEWVALWVPHRESPSATTSTSIAMKAGAPG
jgi:hypothetical protein